MKKELVKFLVLLMVAVGAGPVGAAVYQWSTTAANNAGADPTINWAEGMAPSAVNDSARAMMQQIALWRKDTTGSNLQTAGGPVAYTLTSNQGFTSTALMAGSVLNFYMISSNSAGATLNVDGLGAFPLKISSTGSAIPAGAMLAGGHYTVTFSNTASAFIVENYYDNSFNIPLGGLIQSTISTPPSGNFVAAAGQCISTTTYNTYWVALGSPASGACAGGQFAIIDVRGRSLVALDNLGGTPAGRLTNSGTGCGTTMQTMGASCVNGAQGQTLNSAQIPSGLSVSVSGTVTVTSTTPRTATGTIQSANVTGGADKVFTSDGVNTTISSSGSATLTGATTGGGGGQHPTIDPNIAVYIYLRVI